MKTNLGFVAVLGALALGSFTLAGCKTSMNTVERAEPIGQRARVTDKRVLTDAGLSRKVCIVGVNDSVSAGGLAQVQVEVLNRTRSAQRFNYRFEWFDAAGIRLSSPVGGLLARRIEAGESLFLQSVTPSPSCKDFRLQLIESN